MRPDPLAYLDSELNTLREQGLFRPLRVLDGEQAAQASIDHRSVVNLSSNNYLGFTSHPRLRERALEALRLLGVGTGSVRTIAGTMQIHMELERRLATFKLTEATVVFQVFPHRDIAAARRILTGLPRGQRTLLITDGVFSMDGDLGALPGLCDLADEFGSIMMVDDAHASGVFGAQGRGTVDHFGLHGRVDVQVGTLSKALGALGGYVAGSRSLIEFLYRRARPFLFSTSHPPAVAATCLAALDVLETEPQWMERLWQNTRFFKAGLQALGFDTGTSESPITPVIVGDGSRAVRLSDRLFEEGVFAQSITFPTVARDKARVRTIVTAVHTEAELQFALDIFQKVGAELGIT
jgi:glycine C-acetyltransferase